MYKSLPGWLIGFHGCDKALGEAVLSGKKRLIPSANDYDWLGNGIYFWENNPKRALDYAAYLVDNPGRTKGVIHDPFVIGAIINPGYCLNLLESESLHLVRAGFTLLEQSCNASGYPLPENKELDAEVPLLRNRDCAVIEIIHQFRKEKEEKAFDSVRAMFVEGEPLYSKAGYRDKNHIQICIRNPNCIKGYFRPLDPIEEHDLV